MMLKSEWIIKRKKIKKMNRKKKGKNLNLKKTMKMMMNNLTLENKSEEIKMNEKNYLENEFKIIYRYHNEHSAATKQRIISWLNPTE